MIKKLCALLFLATAVQAFSPVRYVQISTNTLTQQSGGVNVSTITASSTTVTFQTTASSHTFNGPIMLGLSAGTSGQSIQSNGNNTAPSWTNVPSAILSTSSTWTANQIVSSATITRLIVSTFTPTNVIGVTNGSDAPPGDWGEEISSSVIRSNAKTLATTTVISVATVTLTAGDWDVSANCAWLPNAATSVTWIMCGINRTPGAEPSADAIAVPDASGNIKMINNEAANVPAADVVLSIAPVKENISTSVTFYLVSSSQFSVNSMKAYGSIRARRIAH